MRLERRQLTSVEQLGEKDRKRLCKILGTVKRFEEVKKQSRIKPIVSTLRKYAGIRKDDFGPLFKLAKKEGFIEEDGKISTGGPRPGIKHVLTEKGRKYFEEHAYSDPTKNELTLEMYGGAKRMTIKLPKNVEAGWVIDTRYVEYGMLPLIWDSMEIKIEPLGELKTSVDEIEGEMWSSIVHWASREEGWSAYPGVGEERFFKLPDEIHLPSPMAKLKRDLNNFWKSPTISGESRLNEKWIPGFLKDIAPNRIKELKERLKRLEGNRQQIRKELKGPVNKELEEEGKWIRKTLKELNKRGLKEKHQWIMKQLDYYPNTFMPSPLWQMLGFLREEDVLWPAEVSLPFNVNIVGWKELEIYARINSCFPSGDEELVMFTRPYDWEWEEEMDWLPGPKRRARFALIGSPSTFISVLEKYQADPAFDVVWKHWKKRKLRDQIPNILAPVDAAHLRFIFNGVYVHIAQAYLDIWKRCAEKKMTEKEIADIVKEVALAIPEGKYDLALHPKGGKGTT